MLPRWPPRADDDLAQRFEAERPRLVALAARLLADRSEAEDAVQQAWLRLDRATRRAEPGEEVTSLAAWLTTVVSRLCLDRLRQRSPVLDGDLEELAGPGALVDPAPGPDEVVVRVEAVSAALDLVLDRLGPRERVALVLHDSFGVDFPAVAEVLGTTPAAARKLASRARARVAGPSAGRRAAQAEVVDAFMDAARGGDLARLLELLAPGAVIRADAAAVAAGTPARVEGRERVAAFFDGSARSALAVEVDGLPGAAWFLRGEAEVLFDVLVDLDAADGPVRGVVFRADPDVLVRVRRRRPGGVPDAPPGHT
ncbi:sigma-70 family RNA polymerase sigma factor [Quadrisphaera sp. KR29]|uniref:sigma-70 family RNA polymerase sigma factor n=1 Tax=Quadrisphaera sp. KR29 TaxID=3461391 RepID=UPI0040442642